MNVRILALVCCLVLAGCAAPPHAEDEQFTWPEDPPTDRLGWENGYWYNESIEIDQSDGLNAKERSRLVARTMARVERIRGLEFEKTIPVEVVSREQFQSNSRDTVVDTPKEAWREQVWEGMLLVGEDRTVGETFADIYGGSVLGYYSPRADRIVIVSDAEQPTIDRATLAHELVHALQDQQFSLLGAADTRDGQLAESGIVEGDANYVEERYAERCAADWSCIDRPTTATGSGVDPQNLGVYLTVFFPYSDGPHFVHQLRERGGWEAVNDVYRHPPASTEQVIHPEKYPDERPAAVVVPDRSTGNWERFEVKPTADRVGEASIFSMFWYQRGLNRSTLSEDSEAYSRYNYAAEVSAGWAGDQLVPYENANGENGYVWRIRWDTTADAREFETAYRRLLTERLNATEVREDVYRVPEESTFADAFRVVRSGKTVTIVNAPRPRQLERIHAPPAE